MTLNKDKTRKLKMWMVTGKGGGLRCLFPAKWKAGEYIETSLGTYRKPIGVFVSIKT